MQTILSCAQSRQLSNTRLPVTNWNVQRQRCRRQKRFQVAAVTCAASITAGHKLQVVFVTTEVAPWSKAGGVGDVMAALPAALAARGHRVMTVAPRYWQYTDVRDTGVQLPIQMPLDFLQQPLVQQQQSQEQPQGPGEGAAAQQAPRHQEMSAACAEDVAAAAAVYSQAERWAPGNSSSSSSSSSSNRGWAGAGGPCAPGPGLGYARYYMCCSAGVDRVFVDHPLYHGAADGTSGTAQPWPGGVVGSYCHPPGSPAAARDAPDLAAAASVLCQAALAAPMLLWGSGHGLDQQQQLAQQRQQQQELRQQDQQELLQLEWVLLLQLLGVDNGQQLALTCRGAGSTSSSSDGQGLAALLAAAAWQRQQQLAAELQHPQQVVSGVVRPVLLGTGGSEVDRRWPVCDLLLPAKAANKQQQRQEQQQQINLAMASSCNLDESPLIFVANDWPCGVLPLWLDAYREAAAATASALQVLGQQHQQQQEEAGADEWLQHNPYMEWLLGRHNQLLSAVTEGHQQEAAEAQEPQQHCSKQQPGESASSSAALSCAGGERAAVVGLPLDGRSEVPQQQRRPEPEPPPWQQQGQQQAVLQQQQQQPPLEAASMQLMEAEGAAHSSVVNEGLLPAAAAEDGECGDELTADVQLLSDGTSLQRWLGHAAGYMPGSVHDPAATAAVSAVLSSGRVSPGRLQPLLVGQSQLQLLLHQEQLLGDAIERLAASAVGLNQQLLQQQQQRRRRQQEEQRRQQQQQQEQPAPQPQQVAPSIPHSRQVALLQQMLGRQLSDAAVVFAIHNYGYQGIFKGRASFNRLGLPARMLAAFVSPVAQAASRAAASASAAASSAGAALASQLAALAGLLQQLMPASMAAAPDGDPSGSSSSSSREARQAGEQAADAGNDSSDGSAGASGSSRDDVVSGLGMLSGLQAVLQQENLDSTAAALVQAQAQAQAQAAVEAAALEAAAVSEGVPVTGDDALGAALAAAAAAGGSLDGEALLEQLHGLLVHAAEQQGWEPPLSSRGRSNRDAGQPGGVQPGAAGTGQGAAHAAAAAVYEGGGAGAAADAQLEVNWLRAGMAASDALVTVSGGYAQELLAGLDPSGPADPELQALMAAKGLRGVINGIDTACWDPARDPLLPAAVQYGPDTVAAGKAAAKELLQRRLGLTVDPAVPLFVFVGRLTPQKGVDVMLAALPQLMAAAPQQQQSQQSQPEPAGSSALCANSSDGVVASPSSADTGANTQNMLQQQQQQLSSWPSSNHGATGGSPGPPMDSIQLAMLGAGEAWMEEVLGQLAGRYPGAAVGVPAFNEPLAHLMMAGADYLLVPSRSEPCGLVALAGLRYGAVPITTATGGLADIIPPQLGHRLLNPGAEGDTAAFRKGVASLVAVVQAAAAEYGSSSFTARRAAAMAVDVSWEQPCAAWEQLLQQLADARRQRQHHHPTQSTARQPGEADVEVAEASSRGGGGGATTTSSMGMAEQSLLQQQAQAGGVLQQGHQVTQQQHQQQQRNVPGKVAVVAAVAAAAGSLHAF